MKTTSKHLLALLSIRTIMKTAFIFLIIAPSAVVLTDMIIMILQVSKYAVVSGVGILGKVVQ